MFHAVEFGRYNIVVKHDTLMGLCNLLANAHPSKSYLVVLAGKVVGSIERGGFHPSSK